MEWSSSCHLTVFFTLLALSPLLQVVDGLKTPQDRLKCPVRSLKGGRVRIRSRGRVAKYICLSGSQLLGEKYSTCVRGKWDSPVPTCISRGCESVDVLHGQVLETYRGAVVTVHCDPGYTLLGSQSLYCNGAVWNDTAPICKETQVKAQKWCDFESEDLCGWTHDSNHDFDWRRHNFATPSGHVGTGPSCDHTLGPGLSGHYMYLEVSSPRLENDTARLFSPVFNAISDPGTCFIFWYHMFGITTGTLNVYLHKQDTVLLFTKSGDQGDEWLQAVLPLSQIASSFQIVIEGMRGAGYEGDIAIDDVKLAEGQECFVSTSTTLSEEEVTATTEGGSLSCEGRCYSPASEPSMCECTPDCVGDDTCCPDYLQKCLMSVSATSESELTAARLSVTPPATTTGIQNTTLLSNNSLSSVSVLPTNHSTTSVPGYHQVSNETQTVEVTSKIYETNVSTSFKNESSFNGSLTTATMTFSTTTHLPKTTSAPVTNRTVEKQATTSSIIVFTINRSVHNSNTTIFDVTSTVTLPALTNPSLRSTNHTVLPNITGTTTKTLTTKQTTVLFQLNPQRSTPTKTPWPRKQKIEFVTPPPPVIFRKPAKTITKPFTKPSIKPSTKPFTKPVLNYTVVNIPTTFTTQNPKKMLNKTEKVIKSKNDILHPIWLKDTTLTLPPLRPNPRFLSNRTTPSTTYSTTTQSQTTLYLHHSNATKPVTQYRWKSKYKPRDNTPVHAQYAVSSSPSGQMVHILVLVSGALLILATVLATVCVIRRRKINRRRMEDDELDIQFLASDEILDFTLARPSIDGIQLRETRR